MNNSQTGRKGVSSFALKCIAIISMTIDHIGVFLIPEPYNIPFRITGRLAFPLFCFLITEGFIHTRNLRKYILRILFIAIISEPVFDKAFHNSYLYINAQSALFTLMIGLLTITALDTTKAVGSKLNTTEKKAYAIEYNLKAFVIIFASIVIILAKSEFGILGLAMILAFYFLRAQNEILFIVFFIINLLYFEWIQIFACIALILIYYYNGQRGRKIKYLFYSFYPIHLALLTIISVLLITYTISTDINKNNIESNIISSDSVTSVDLQSTINITTLIEEERCTIQSFSLEQNTMAVFTKENEQGWFLESGDVFSLAFSINTTDDVDQANIMLGMIVNGFYSDIISIENDTFEMSINAYQDGEYYYTIINLSADIITIDNGIIIAE